MHAGVRHRATRGVEIAALRCDLRFSCLTTNDRPGLISFSRWRPAIERRVNCWRGNGVLPSAPRDLSRIVTALQCSRRLSISFARGSRSAHGLRRRAVCATCGGRRRSIRCHARRCVRRHSDHNTTAARSGEFSGSAERGDLAAVTRPQPAGSEARLSGVRSRRRESRTDDKAPPPLRRNAPNGRVLHSPEQPRNSRWYSADPRETPAAVAVHDIAIQHRQPTRRALETRATDRCAITPAIALLRIASRRPLRTSQLPSADPTFSIAQSLKVLPQYRGSTHTIIDQYLESGEVSYPINRV